MMKRKCFWIIFAVLIGLSATAYADQNAEEILKAVVKIRSMIPKDAHTANTLGTEREGNGVVIDPDGLILTIGYIIVEAETIEVIGPDGKPFSATFVGYDHSTGFGLLRTDKPPNVVPIKLGQSSTVKVGDPILVAGYGGTDSAIAGRVISRKEFAGYWEYLLDEPIYTAPAYSNFGGAALLNPDGQLLGIGSLFNQLMIPGLGMIPCNIFVPIDLLHPILNDLKTAGRSRKTPRPWLGINAEEAHGRIFITRVTSGGPAEVAGLQAGDLILSVKGKTVSGLADFYRKIWEVGNAGVDVPLSLLRGTQIQSITVRSADRYQFLLLKPKKI
jgi:S1-C subfamily serine protease